MSKPTIPEVLPEAREFGRANPVACCLHIMLDDGNVTDSDARFCLELARTQGHPKCVALAEKLALMSRTQRLKIQGQMWRKS